jgi:hypothetical protein
MAAPFDGRPSDSFILSSSTRYSENGAPSSITLTTQLNLGSSRYLRITGQNGTLLVLADTATHLTKICKIEEGKVFVGPTDKQKPKWADDYSAAPTGSQRTSCSFGREKCFKIVEHHGSIDAETWYRADVPKDAVAYFFYTNGKINESSLRILKRSPCETDKEQFTLPKSKAVNVSSDFISNMFKKYMDEALGHGGPAIR